LRISSMFILSNVEKNVKYNQKEEMRIPQNRSEENAKIHVNEENAANDQEQGCRGRPPAAEAFRGFSYALSIP